MGGTEVREAAQSGQAEPEADGQGTVLRVHALTKSFHRGLPPRRRTIEVLKGAEDAELKERATAIIDAQRRGRGIAEPRPPGAAPPRLSPTNDRKEDRALSSWGFAIGGV